MQLFLWLVHAAEAKRTDNLQTDHLDHLNPSAVMKWCA